MTRIDNVVVVRFTEPSKAYQALSVIKDCAADGRIGLESAAVVERTPDGQLHLPESTDSVGLVGTASGSMVGMLLGVIGGPLGVLIGMGTGALMGGLVDMDRADTTEDAVATLARAIPPGSTAVIASVIEPAVEVLDHEMQQLGGEVTRRPVGAVIDEVEAAEEVADTAAKDARRALRERRKTELKAGMDERTQKLKEKLVVS
jgi:uncharacterized membrane protein